MKNLVLPIITLGFIGLVHAQPYQCLTAQTSHGIGASKQDKILSLRNSTSDMLYTRVASHSNFDNLGEGFNKINPMTWIAIKPGKTFVTHINANSYYNDQYAVISIKGNGINGYMGILTLMNRDKGMQVSLGCHGTNCGIYKTFAHCDGYKLLIVEDTAIPYNDNTPSHNSKYLNINIFDTYSIFGNTRYDNSQLIGYQDPQMATSQSGITHDEN